MDKVTLVFKAKSPKGFAVDIHIDSTRENYPADLSGADEWLSSHGYKPQPVAQSGGGGSWGKKKQRGKIIFNPETSLVEFTIPWRGVGDTKEARLEVHKAYQAEILKSITQETKVSANTDVRDVDGKKEYWYILGGGVPVYRRALELLPEDDYERDSSIVKFLEQHNEQHWTETQNWPKFWIWTKDIGLTDEQVHDALRVDSVKDFKGTKEEAMRLIEVAAND